MLASSFTFVVDEDPNCVLVVGCTGKVDEGWLVEVSSAIGVEVAVEFTCWAFGVIKLEVVCVLVEFTLPFVSALTKNQIKTFNS